MSPWTGISKLHQSTEDPTSFLRAANSFPGVLSTKLADLNGAEKVLSVFRFSSAVAPICRALLRVVLHTIASRNSSRLATWTFCKRWTWKSRLCWEACKKTFMVCQQHEGTAPRAPQEHALNSLVTSVRFRVLRGLGLCFWRLRHRYYHRSKKGLSPKFDLDAQVFFDRKQHSCLGIKLYTTKKRSGSLWLGNQRQSRLFLTASARLQHLGVFQWRYYLQRTKGSAYDHPRQESLSNDKGPVQAIWAWLLCIRKSGSEPSPELFKTRKVWGVE